MSEPLLSIELHLALTGVELLSLNQEISGVGFPIKSHGRLNSWSYWKRKNFSAFKKSSQIHPKFSQIFWKIKKTGKLNTNFITCTVDRWLRAFCILLYNFTANILCQSNSHICGNYNRGMNAVDFLHTKHADFDSLTARTWCLLADQMMRYSAEKKIF